MIDTNHNSKCRVPFLHRALFFMFCCDCSPFPDVFVVTFLLCQQKPDAVTIDPFFHASTA
jgi:hypothetical protein